MPRKAAAKSESQAIHEATTTPHPSADKEFRPSASGEKVVVGCKIGVPWVELQVQQIRKTSEETRTGNREIDVWVKTGPVIMIRGTSYPRGTVPEGFTPAPEMVSGYAITRNIDKDIWDEIARQNKRNPNFVNQMIVAGPDTDHIRGIAMEREALLSGMEPLNPGEDKRIMKSSNKAVGNIEAAQRK